MRPAPALLLFLFLGFFSFPTSAQVTTLQVTDASAPDSPIHISGSLIVAESIETSPRCAVVHAQRCALTSTQYDVTLRNISDQPIVAYVANVNGQTSEGHYLGRGYHAERIFGSLFAPGTGETWPNSGGVEITPQTAEVQPTNPSAAGQVLFVQFADGTTFGDRKAGEGLLLNRQQLLERLVQLDAIYTRQGEQAFDKAARQPNAGGMLGIAQFEKEDGPVATIARIRHMLATAEQRLAAMNAQAAR